LTFVIGKALDDGNDLVECSTIFPTCDICAKYQGRIYSISGKTEGYPALYETAFSHGYSIIHPNCRHQFYPYNPKFHTEEERQRLEEGTRRPWTDEGQQGEAARQAYARSQSQMRQWNNELNKFAEYQKQCSERGEKPVYTNLGSFRKAHRSAEGTAPYAKSHYFKRDDRQYREYESIIGKSNMPETLDKFQGLKYNKDEEKRRDFYLLSREHKLKSESIGQPKLRNFKNAVIEVSKTRDYLLNPNNKTGKDKAHVLKSVLGYTKNDFRELSDNIYSNLPHYKVGEKKDTEFGSRYNVDMVLIGKNGRRLEVVTVWQYDNGSKFPRFITMKFTAKKKV
jgi:hypothetical protein